MLKNALAVMILVVYCSAFGIVTKWFLANDNSSKVTNVEEYSNEISYNYKEDTEEEEVLLEEKDYSKLDDDLETQKSVSSRSGQRQRETLTEEPVIENVNNEMSDIITEHDFTSTYEQDIVVDTVIEEPVISRESVEDNNLIPQFYYGHEVVGRIEIPKTGVDLFILKNITASGMEVASCIYYSKGDFNKNGIHLIGGHNYMNGKLFSNNERLVVGDKIYITTLDGSRNEYTVYNIFLTTSDDTSYLKRDEGCSPEIFLQSCVCDGTERIRIVQAR